MARKQKAIAKLATPIVHAQREAPASIPEEPKDDFWADEKKDKALLCLLGGMSKSATAKHVDVHRNTIDNWCKDTRFATELEKRMREHMGAKRVQRLKSTNLLNDKVERVALSLASQIEHDLDIDKTTGRPAKGITKELERTMRTFREMSYEFRENREQERKDFGDDVKKVAINSNTTITGDINHKHSTVNKTPFADYMRSALANKVIDAKHIEVKEGDNNGQLLLKTAEALLIDSDLLDQLHAEEETDESAGEF